MAILAHQIDLINEGRGISYDAIMQPPNDHEDSVKEHRRAHRMFASHLATIKPDANDDAYPVFWGMPIDTYAVHLQTHSRPAYTIEKPEDALIYVRNPNNPNANIREWGEGHPIISTLLADQSIAVRGTFWAVESDSIPVVGEHGMEEMAPARYLLMELLTCEKIIISLEEEDLPAAAALNERNLRLGLRRRDSSLRLIGGQKEPPQAAREVRSTPLPDIIPFHTSQEPQALFNAIRDMHLGGVNFSWGGDDTDPYFIHRTPKSSHEARIQRADAVESWGQIQSAVDFMTLTDPDTEFCAYLLVGWCASQPLLMAEVSSIRNALGWAPKKKGEREEMDRRIVGMVKQISSIIVTGKREGWKNPDNHNKPENLTVASKLVAITGVEYADQLTLDGSAVPRIIHLAAGPALLELRRVPGALQYLGNLRSVASIPSGRPGGHWARYLGVEVARLWRTNATKLDRVSASGGYTTTRRALYKRLPGTENIPTLDQVLEGDDPGRAIKYDADAWDHLQERGLISNASEIKYSTAGKSRKGWKEDFRDCLITIKPREDVMTQINVIRAPALAAAAKKRGRPPKAKAARK